MSISELRDAVIMGAYRFMTPRPQEVPYKEELNKSIRWNQEQRDRAKAEYQAALKAWHNEYVEAERELSAKFREDAIAALQQDYTLNSAQCELVFQKAYEQGHSYGFGEVLQYACDFAEFAEQILKKN